MIALETAARNLLAHWDTPAWKQTQPTADLMGDLRRAINNPPKNSSIESCNWIQDDDGDAWAGDCGIYFVIIEGTPSENNMKFCPHCGKLIAEHPFQWPADDDDDCDQPRQHRYAGHFGD